MIEIKDWGLTEYEDALVRQREIFGKMVAQKKEHLSPPNGYLILTEHYPVITLGKHAKPENVIQGSAALAQHNIKVVEIERGGDVTCHEPGQLVVYPIIDLLSYRLGVKKYVELLEECVIQTLQKFGIVGERVDGAPGVWIMRGGSKEKICALGIKCSHYCTMHGIALNVCNDLATFRNINPCGFTEYGVTSMRREMEKDITVEEVKSAFAATFLSLILPLKE